MRVDEAGDHDVPRGVEHGIHGRSGSAPRGHALHDAAALHNDAPRSALSARIARGSLIHSRMWSPRVRRRDSDHAGSKARNAARKQACSSCQSYSG